MSGRTYCWDDSNYKRRYEERGSCHKDREEYITQDIEYKKLREIIEEVVKEALKSISIHVEVNPEINLVNDTQREVAIGKKGVGAGENTNIGIVGNDGSVGAGDNPVVDENAVKRSAQ